MRRTPINNNIQRTHSRIFKYPLYLYQINPQPIIAASQPARESDRTRTYANNKISPDKRLFQKFDEDFLPNVIACKLIKKIRKH